MSFPGFPITSDALLFLYRGISVGVGVDGEWRGVMVRVGKNPSCATMFLTSAFLPTKNPIAKHKPTTKQYRIFHIDRSINEAG